MSEGGSRRAVAEIRFGEDRSGLTKVGGRSIHQYWSLLSPHFRDVLLAPQRRSDDGGVAWTWREAMDKKPLTAAELAGVRKRLERGNESFAENPVNPLAGDDRSGTSSQALIDQVAAKVKAMADSLAAKSDAALVDFVCRTETGAMIHSWGVASPAPIYYPDALESGVSGVVLVGGKPSAAGYEVVVENAQGLSVARTQSDEAGEFLFSKIAPGRYRVRVTSGRVKFPAKGATVTVERGAMTRLELASTTNPDEPDESTIENADESSTATSPGSLSSTSSRKKGRTGKTVAVLLLVLLLGGGGVWVWRSWSPSSEKDERIVAQTSSMTPEAFADGDKKTNSSRLSANTADDNGASPATVDGAGGTKSRQTQPASAEGFETPRATILGRERTSSTIGSRIEVLSGVAAPGPSAVTTSGVNGPAPSILPGQSSEQRSIAEPEKIVQGVSSVMKPPPKTGKDIRVVLADPSAAGTASEAGSPGAGAGSLENNNAMPGENQAGAINDTSGRKAPGGTSAVSGGTKAGEGEAASEEGSELASMTTDTAQDSVAVEKTKTGQPQKQGPKVMTSVVEKKQTGNSAKPSANTNESHKGEATADAEKQTAPVPRTASAKSGQSKPKTGPAASPDGAASALPSEGTSAAKSAPLVGGLPGNAADAAQAEPKADEKTMDAENAAEPEAEPALDEAFISGAVSREKPREVKIEIRVPVWKCKMTRDAIVPTLPVLIGESDAAELSRNILLAEKRKLLPETFRSPVVHYGIGLQVDPALGSQPMAWTVTSGDRAMQGSVQDNRGELVWLAGTAGEGKRVLKNAEGVEVARVVFARDGVVRLELVGNTRAVFWIGVARSPMDGAAAKDQKPGRFGWQVLRGTAPHLSWRDDDVWPGGRGLRLEVALNNKPVSRTMVGVVDRLTGWSFSWEL
ncbi:MAG: carboxypeptidase regulatory-like domain-containing protein [Verrucomicrobia bacterium]|nr:carboxypeptidase regulatory-like domain-containing protein [Verrucomicrobiota bacterium]